MNVAEIFEEHHEALFRYLVRLTGDEDLAADATQEAFVRLVERPPPHERVRAWLFTVGTNVVRDDARLRRRRFELLSGSPDRVPVGDSPLRPDAVLEREELRRSVRGAMESLSERDRTLLLMREEGFTHREIADAVGTTTKSVGSMVARALQKLSTRLVYDKEILE
ncbi:RNA polymerase sigma factor SigX [soil metagenome]